MTGRPEDASVRLMTRALVLYYRQGLTQQQVAHRMGVSRATVGRFLARAEEVGLVTISITSPFQRLVETEVALAGTYGLAEAVVTESSEPGNEGSVRLELGRGCAELIARRLVPGMVLGLGWSRTVQCISDALAHGEPVPAMAGLTVVQLDGATMPMSGQPHPILGIAAVAARLGADNVVMPAPLYVDDEATARGLAKDNGVNRALELASRADVCIFGIGNMADDTTLVVTGEVDAATMSALVTLGAVGDVCGRYFDSSGRAVNGDLASRTISVSLDVLRTRPLRVAAVAGAGRVEAVHAALRGGLANALVTDSLTADALLGRAGSTPARKQDPGITRMTSLTTAGGRTHQKGTRT